MGSAIPSPTDQTLSSTSRTDNYFGKVWEDSPFKLNEYFHKHLISKPRTKESISCTSLEHTENNISTHYEGKYRLKGSSRHRTSITSIGGNPHTDRASKHPSQKAMLSKALQKANTAVLLDNAHNFEGAKQAYSEACALLQQVISRSSGDNDRRKLEAIRNTYTSRIDDLEKISPYNSDLSKALPARPEISLRNTDTSKIINSEQEDELSATMNNPSCQSDQPLSRSMSSSQLPPRRESLLHLAPDTSLFKLESYTGGTHENIPIEKIDSHEKCTESLYIGPSFSSQQSSPKDLRNSASSQQRKFSAEVAESDINNLSSLLLDEYDEDEIVANVRRRVNLAKQRVLESEHEAAMQLAHGLERTRLQQQESYNTNLDDPGSNESEEEERMLEEMTRDYVMDDFEFDLQCKSALPRESDSSGFSGRTWSSSMESNPTTIGTNVSNKSKACSKPQFASLQFVNPKTGPPSPPLPPPQQALPSTPSPKNIGLPSTFFEPNSPTVINRTLLGQSYKPFQLETDINPTTEYSESSTKSNHSRISSNGNLSQSKTGESNNMRQNFNPDSPRHQMLPLILQQQTTTSLSEKSSAELFPISMSLPLQAISNDIDSKYPRPGSPAPVHSSSLRKKYSSSSLRNIKNRSTVISHIEDGSDLSPLTPVSSRFNAKVETTQTHSVTRNFPTFLSTANREKKTRSQNGNSYLLESDVNFPEISGPPSGNDDGASISLEPCPTEYLLRPFWLMRALYHTITHPKGGYISSKLYIPCDVWRVKGVKIKNLEEKISSCDLLTAALNRLSKFDTLEANAVLDEMHVFETVLEQTQTLLSKKLGNEVGAQNFGISVGLKEGMLDGDPENSNSSHRSGSTSGKSTFSWRRLRTKNSGLGLSHGFSNKSSSEAIKENLRIKSLPMTSNTTTKMRFAKKDINEVKFTGPNSNYMNALARLFDAAQIIDQIARQVSDPGLRHAEKTQAGLELCIRHAAEFFSFYICRFVLSDIGTLLDKFVKKGGEWVLL